MTEDELLEGMAGTSDPLAALRERHRQAKGYEHPHEACIGCGQRWPCDTARVLAALAAVTEEPVA